MANFERSTERRGGRGDSDDASPSRGFRRSSFDDKPRGRSGGRGFGDRDSSDGNRGGSRGGSYGDRGSSRGSSYGDRGGSRGGSYGDRGGSRGGGFGDRGRREVEMTKVTCSSCGIKCEVPFKPTSSKPVYCDACFSKDKGNSGSGVSSKDLELINEKLDMIIKALKTKPAKTKSEDTKSEDTKSEDTKSEDTKPSKTKSTKTKTSKAKSSKTKKEDTE